MATGLLALLDDVAAISKLAAASLDDVVAGAAKAGAKAAGIVIDDAAVTPRYVVGLSPARELPIIWAIARGSFRNKLLILLPAALALAAFAPWAITPLLMAGGLYLAFEGTEKLLEALGLVSHHGPEEDLAGDPALLERTKVAQAIRTDLILSAEIMAIALSTVPEARFWTQAAVLLVVGVGITVVVYGAVALLVKADDAGVALAARGGPSAPLGRGLVHAMPAVMKALSVIGTAAMIWVGGGILLHGLAEYGLAGPEHLLAGWGAALGGGLLGWVVMAAGSGVLGLLAGGVATALVLGWKAWRRPALAAGGVHR